MKIATQLPYAKHFKESAEKTVALEKAGLDIVYVAEVYGYDGVSQMGYLAAKTSTVQIASGILSLYLRTPTLQAMTAAGVDFLSDGRHIMGIGASGPQVVEGFHGVPYHAPLGRTREIVDICRKVWKREEKLTHNGKHFQIPLPESQGTGLGKPLKMINHPVRDSIPIHIASLGPKNVALTAEIAEGWLPMFFLPEQASNVFGRSLAEGTAQRESALGALDIVAGGLMAIGDDVKGVLDFARPLAALYIGGMGARGKNFYNTLVSKYGYEEECAKIQDLYLEGKRTEAEALVPTEFLELTNLVGPTGYVKERIAAYAEAGVTTLAVSPVGEDPPKLLEEFKSLT